MSLPKSITDGTTPTYLDARYEIRQLTVADIPWASAIIIHSNMFHSPIWPLVYPGDKIKRAHRAMAATNYLVRHQVESGMSFGVFDTKYEYKRPESAATQGKIYWDEDDLNSDSAALLQQMDFPLISIALAYDGANPLDLPQMMSLIEVLPLFGTLYQALESLDKRDPVSWKAKGQREVLMRNGTSTRADYEGKGFTRKLANWLMQEAALQGYRGIQIECAHNAVTNTWLHPPKPFHAELIGSIDMATYEQENGDGSKFKPFAPSKQVCTKIYVTLKEGQPRQNKANGNIPAVNRNVGTVG